MFSRVALPCFAVTTALAILACQSSGQYGTPANAALNTGIAVAGAAVSRAAGGCYAQCLPGTVCNHATGLCDRLDPTKATKSTAGPHGRPPLTANASYPPGYESEIPPLADAGCDPPPASAGDAGALSCEMDASAPH